MERLKQPPDPASPKPTTGRGERALFVAAIVAVAAVLALLARDFWFRG